MTEWAHVYHIYYRVLIWHAVSLHILAAAAFGGWNWGSISTACVTHSLLKLLRVIVDARIGHPPRSSSSVLRSGSKLASDAKEWCERSGSNERAPALDLE